MENNKSEREWYENQRKSLLEDKKKVERQLASIEKELNKIENIIKDRFEK